MLDNGKRQEILENYIQSYNTFNVEGMIQDLHEDVIFENVSKGEVGLTTTGIERFKKQAESALGYFSKREQKITSWKFEEDKIIIEINYHAVLSIDFPNGMKLGDELNMKGKSIFEFKNEKIIKIRDES
ncbi:MAG: nuclear transport factor 2 family protein [Bacteroidota bacterium]